ncbi:MAG: DUF2259 domain-containing protein [Rhizobiales bacterium]|nr:DUF2259 domain-containing protein [Hyphomicrobiales bacterium]
MRFLALCFSLAATILLGINHANAGDQAERRIIGFSENGAYFAFEQFGVQDGSGFPYSDIFILNIANDSWAGGSPFRTRLDDETQGLNEARTITAGKAAAAISSLGIHDAGILLASNPITEIGADAHHVAFRPTNQIGAEWQLDINQFSLPVAGCSGFDQDIRGFALFLTMDENQEPKNLHQDHSIPSSRHCPLNYGISDVILHGDYNAPNQLIVLVRVMSVGFEGPDLRFIAIPAIVN